MPGGEREQEIEKGRQAVVYTFSTEATINRVASQGKAAVKRALENFRVRVVLHKVPK